MEPPEAFEESFEFENEVETIEPLLFMLRRFLQQICTRLNGIYLVAEELTLRITFSHRQQYERCFKIPQPTNDVDLLFRMLHTHLENFTSKHPIIAGPLEAQPIKPARQQFGLFQTALRDPNQLYETLARLTALLGTDRVGTPVLEETYRPDAFRMEPFVWNLNANANGTCGSAAVREGAALRRFRPAPLAAVLLDENMPAHLRTPNLSGKIADQRGPYFASGNWWDEKSWTRAEWDLQLDNNVLLRCHQSGETWEIDGVYD